MNVLGHYTIINKMHTCFNIKRASEDIQSGQQIMRHSVFLHIVLWQAPAIHHFGSPARRSINPKKMSRGILAVFY